LDLDFTPSTGETTMRKLLLAAAILMVSVTANADPSFQVAADDPPQNQPAVTAAEPAKPSEPTQVVEPAKAAEATPVVETKPVQISKPKQRAANRESDEHKARRIAAKFGVYW
jgi:hypothetical protein